MHQHLRTRIAIAKDQITQSTITWRGISPSTFMSLNSTIEHGHSKPPVNKYCGVDFGKLEWIASSMDRSWWTTARPTPPLDSKRSMMSFMALAFGCKDLSSKQVSATAFSLGLQYCKISCDSCRVSSSKPKVSFEHAVHRPWSSAVVHKASLPRRVVIFLPQGVESSIEALSIDSATVIHWYCW